MHFHPIPFWDLYLCPWQPKAYWLSQGLGGELIQLSLPDLL
jgi:hypothetical protein